MWLENLKELKKKTGMPVKQIADMTNLPERTVVRIFSGDTPNPYVDTLHRIVNILGGSLDSILADTKTVVGNTDLAGLQTKLDLLNDELTDVNTENAMLKDKIAVLTAEIEILRMKVEHKEEIIALHNYYNALKKKG